MSCWKWLLLQKIIFISKCIESIGLLEEILLFNWIFEFTLFMKIIFVWLHCLIHSRTNQLEQNVEHFLIKWVFNHKSIRKKIKYINEFVEAFVETLNWIISTRISKYSQMISDEKHLCSRLTTKLFFNTSSYVSVTKQPSPVEK